MKKIYLSLAGLIFCGSIIGQTAPNATTHAYPKGQIAPNTKGPVRTSSADRSPSFSTWIEVVGDVMTNKGLDLTSTSPNQDYFLDIINCDSTVKVSSTTSTRFIDDVMLGTVLDPKSQFLDPSLNPLVTNAEPYYIDSIMILGSYVKVTPTVDTLYAWIVWGDSASTSTTFSKRLTSSLWVPPIASWRYEVIGAKVTGAIGAAGNKVTAAAPAAKKVLVKYVLTDSDSSSAGFSKYITIPLPLAQLSIPAGNIVSCFYTFVPGATPAVGSVSYSFTGGSPQTVNGFAGMIWNQTNPTVTAVADYVDHQVDPSSWCMGTTYGKNQRHLAYPASYCNSHFGDLTTAPVIFYKVSNVYTGINENNNNFSLTQNQPNPFAATTAINYQLSKSANSVSLEVFDVRGVKVYGSKESNQKPGSYTVNINNVNFTPGVYFYSLTVDGAKVTKKMIAQ